MVSEILVVARELEALRKLGEMLGFSFHGSSRLQLRSLRRPSCDSTMQFTLLGSAELDWITDFDETAFCIELVCDYV